MTPEKKKRVTNAVGFLSGVLACLDAVRDARIFWPPDELWDGLRHVQRVELSAGICAHCGQHGFDGHAEADGMMAMPRGRVRRLRRWACPLAVRLRGSPGRSADHSFPAVSGLDRHRGNAR